MEQLALSFDDIPNYKDLSKYKAGGVFKSKKEVITELQALGRSKIIRVLSFGGAGTQSTHLLEQHIQGKIHYDYIIMSDTGAEPDFIMQQVKWWQHRLAEHNINTPFIITHHGKMPGGIEEMLFRWLKTDYRSLQLPVYTSKLDDDGNEIPAGLLPRQCTVDFKIMPVQRWIRYQILENHGLNIRQAFPKDVGIVIDLGFSFDEIRRVNKYKSLDYKYVYFSYPLIEQGLSTYDSINHLREHNMPLKRSRCYCCPFNCDKKGIEWREIIEEEYLSFLKACYIDEQLRVVQLDSRKNLRTIPYLHYSRRLSKNIIRANMSVPQKRIL